MTKIEIVRADMITAMKEGNKKKKESLSMLLSALKNMAIDKRADLTEEEENQVILKELKQTKETLTTTPDDRTDIIEECTFRISVYEEYAPKMMDKEEIETIIKEILTTLSIDSPKASDKGRIMKELMPKVKGKADGSLVNSLVGELLK